MNGCKLFFLLLFFSSCQKLPEQKEEHAFPVQIGLVTTCKAPIFLEALGHVEPITTIEIRSRIEGAITKIAVQEGSEVKKGDLLFQIDPKPYEAILRQARAQLEENLANLALAEEKLRRYRILAKEEYYSQIDYETLQANYVATAALVEQTRATVERAEINLDYCTISAPIEGRLGILNVTYGNLVSAPDGISGPLILLNQMDPIYVTFSIPEYQLPKIQKKEAQLQVIASFEDFVSSRFAGKLFMLDNQVGPATGMIRLKAIFENGKRSLWPGQFIRTRVILEEIENALLIPFSAVQMTLTEPIVFVVNEEARVEQRTVLLGQREGTQIMVLKGLKPNEKIVLDGQINLYNGAKVFVPKATP
ncbi:MAG TPA: efflux RND transporter periplasmic adaptor subunit [Chlamydiales bacterium]|nr:efflux RND transporter periplasmic adaptor subunit [Chlamydiales bacterium]